MANSFLSSLLLYVSIILASTLDSSAYPPAADISWLSYAGSSYYPFFVNYNGFDWLLPQQAVLNGFVQNSLGFPVVDSNGTIYTLVSNGNPCSWDATVISCSAVLIATYADQTLKWKRTISVSSPFLLLDYIGNLYYVFAYSIYTSIVCVDTVAGNQKWNSALTNGQLPYTSQVCYDSRLGRAIFAISRSADRAFATLSNGGIILSSWSVNQAITWPMFINAASSIITVSGEGFVIMDPSSYDPMFVSIPGPCVNPVGMPFVVGTYALMFCLGQGWSDGSAAVYILDTVAHSSSLLINQQCFAAATVNAYTVYMTCLSTTGQSQILQFLPASNTWMNTTFSFSPSITLRNPMMIIGNVIITGTSIPTTMFSWNRVTNESSFMDLTGAIHLDPNDFIQLVTPYVTPSGLLLYFRVFTGGDASSIFRGSGTDYIIQVPTPSATPTSSATPSGSPSPQGECLPITERPWFIGIISCLCIFILSATIIIWIRLYHSRRILTSVTTPVKIQDYPSSSSFPKWRL